MSKVDWAIVLFPLLVVLFIGWRARRHVKSVSDFLTGGRVAGRYVVAVASGEASMGLITVVAFFELYYRSGFAIGFWNMLSVPITLVVTLTGFAIYRYRETRAMTMAQFFEVRYSRRFRIFAGLLAWLAGVINYAVFPAVGGRFLVYYCNLPETVHLFSIPVSTYGLVMAIFLSVAVLIVTLGGQLTTMVTDCVAGMFSYAMYAAVVVTILATFKWGHMETALLNRPPGESMIDPFDTARLTEFNLFFVFVNIFGGLYNILSWQGAQGYNAAAASPHEQKMGMVLGAWRSSFSTLMVVLLSVAAWTYMHHSEYASGAAAVQDELTSKINLGNEATTNQIRDQMRVPIAVRHFLPVGVIGAFCAAMVFMLVSVDTTYLHSWGSILVQDVILPLRKKPFTPQRQILMLRLSIIGVACFAFIWSLFFNQVTYLLLLFALTGAVYLGGAGAVILGGLYWKRGTAAGAWGAMLSGATVAAIGFSLTQFWPTRIYPYLIAHAPDAFEKVSRGLESIGDVLPFVQWKVTPDRFPISGQEIYFLAMMCSCTAYILLSLLTCREPFNLERMLHRGKYRRTEDQPQELGVLAKPVKNWKRIFLGIDEQFSRGDKILAVIVFSYSMVIFLIWLSVTVWNFTVGRFTPHGWANYFWFMNVGLALVVSAVTSVWFTIGGVLGLCQMFVRLRTLKRRSTDDGRVIGHSNADDVLNDEKSASDGAGEGETAVPTGGAR